MTIKGPYLILTNPDTLINTTANRLTRSHIRTEVSHLSGYNVNTGIINDPSLCHKIKRHQIGVIRKNVRKFLNIFDFFVKKCQKVDSSVKMSAKSHDVIISKCNYLKIRKGSSKSACRVEPVTNVSFFLKRVF